MFNTDPDTGLTPRKRFAMPALPMPQMDAQPDGPPNPFEKALAMGSALGNTPPPDSGTAPPKPKLGAPPAAAGSPAPKLGAAPTTSPDGSATVAQQPAPLGKKPFFSAAERGIKNPVFRTLAEIGDVAGSALFPNITNNIPGTRGAEMLSENRGLAQDKERAETSHLDAETKKLGNPVPKAENPEADAYAVLSDPNSTPEQRDAATKALETVKGAGKQDKTIADPKAGYAQAIAEAIQGGRDPNTDPHVQAWKAAIDNISKQEKPASPEQQFIDEYQQKHKGASIAEAQRAYAVNHEPPQRDQRQLAVGPDGTVLELKPGMKIPQGSKTMSGDLAGPKVSADEQKRADLVENLNENLDQLEDIVTRRPELFGSVAGRWTKMKEYIGSDDKDIAALKGIEDRLGMVQQSSHGMRSAQHVAASADSILNGFKNGPEAMKRAIADARKSGATFTTDAQRGKDGGEAWAAPKDAPAAPKEDGHQLKKGGKTIAVSKGGQWAQPPQQ